jgi:hypothetical protein
MLFGLLSPADGTSIRATNGRVLMPLIVTIARTHARAGATAMLWLLRDRDVTEYPRHFQVGHQILHVLCFAREYYSSTFSMAEAPAAVKLRSYALRARRTTVTPAAVAGSTTPPSGSGSLPARSEPIAGPGDEPSGGQPRSEAGDASGIGRDEYLHPELRPFGAALLEHAGDDIKSKVCCG